MSGWRNQKTHREETTAVKKALRGAGIRATKVGHGNGTAWGWLDIHLPAASTPATRAKALDVAQQVTGRTGDYNGRISIY